MTTISFKAEDNFKQKIDSLAKYKGITTSAYIKLILTKEMNGELAELTANGLTVAEELEILAGDSDNQLEGPFKSAKSLMKALKK
ncbi:hypothetical protein KKG71_02965 [Patescibacteria group bacterium]|nr:hypothetical protein [Patescibacteria group bacterium]